MRVRHVFVCVWSRVPSTVSLLRLHKRWHTTVRACSQSARCTPAWPPPRCTEPLTRPAPPQIRDRRAVHHVCVGGVASGHPPRRVWLQEPAVRRLRLTASVARFVRTGVGGRGVLSPNAQRAGAGSDCPPPHHPYEVIEGVGSAAAVAILQQFYERGNVRGTRRVLLCHRWWRHTHRGGAVTQRHTHTDPSKARHPVLPRGYGRSLAGTPQTWPSDFR